LEKAAPVGEAPLSHCEAAQAHAVADTLSLVHALLWDGALDLDKLAVELVELVDARTIHSRRVVKGDEAKATWLARVRVAHDDAVDDRPEERKVADEVVLARVVREAAHEDLVRRELSIGAATRAAELRRAVHGAAAAPPTAPATRTA
jgi:hypothetical protein